MADNGLVAIKRALVSVSDKAGLVEFARVLSRHGVEILSTGGSARALEEAGIAVAGVSDVTGFPEIMDGRVKTLHPRIHGGILARRDLESHRQAMAEHDIGPIDLVVVNLYPFAATRRSGADFATCIENIDIGGPAMVRAAAKNHAFVTIVTDPADYPAVIAELEAQAGATSATLRRRLARRAYAHTATYDGEIAAWLAEENEETYGETFTLAARRSEVLRYGENPHQGAAFYATSEARPGVATARQLQGKALSYNNLNDTDAAYELVAELADPAGPSAAVAIIKHANPCGAALGGSLLEAYEKALACDPVSAFGGIVACSQALDAAAAARIAELFVEVIIAPEVTPEAAALLAERKNLRVLAAGALPDPGGRGQIVKSLSGGLLVQDRDGGRISGDALRVVTKRAPDEAELRDLVFAFRVAKHVKSNAIVYARETTTVGIGAGQMSRVDSARIAAWKAREAAAKAPAGSVQELGAEGSVVASDAFFPFADGLMAAVEAGATAVIQPGGSMRDEEVIAAADEAGLAMVFTGLRHFRH